ncbi:unnamed protein product, partial [Heterosigma akashiwo]
IAKSKLAQPFDMLQVLVFEEEFDAFDLDIWQHEITMGGNKNWEFQYYTNNRTNSYVENGVLNLNPTLTAGNIGNASVMGTYGTFMMDLSGSAPADLCTSNEAFGCSRSSNVLWKMMIPPVQSARIRTVDSLRFKYGRLEVRAKLPRGDWLHPYLALWPATNAYGQWPASGAIDLLDSRGNDASYPPGGNNAITSGVHFGTDWSNDQNWKFRKSQNLTDSDFSSSFHTFGLYWDEEQMYTYVDTDSNRVVEVTFETDTFDADDFGNRQNPWAGGGKNAPFDQDFYFIAGVAVGGTNGYFPAGAGGKPWEDLGSVHGAANLDFWAAVDDWYPSWTQPAMQIESVKLWQEKGKSNVNSYRVKSQFAAVEDIPFVPSVAAAQHSSSFSM